MASSRRRAPVAACAGRDTYRRSGAARSDARAAGAGVAPRGGLVRDRDARDPGAHWIACPGCRSGRSGGCRPARVLEVVDRRSRTAHVVRVAVVRLVGQRRLVAGVRARRSAGDDPDVVAPSVRAAPAPGPRRGSLRRCRALRRRRGHSRLETGIEYLRWTHVHRTHDRHPAAALLARRGLSLYTRLLAVGARLALYSG